MGFDDRDKLVKLSGPVNTAMSLTVSVVSIVRSAIWRNFFRKK